MKRLIAKIEPIARNSDPQMSWSKLVGIPTDYTIVCEKTNIPVHHFLLCLKVPFFLTRCKVDPNSNSYTFSEPSIVSPKTVQHFVDSLYGENLVIDETSASELFVLCEQWSIESNALYNQFLQFPKMVLSLERKSMFSDFVTSNPKLQKNVNCFGDCKVARVSVDKICINKGGLTLVVRTTSDFLSCSAGHLWTRNEGKLECHILQKDERYSMNCPISLTCGSFQNRLLTCFENQFQIIQVSEKSMDLVWKSELKDQRYVTSSKFLLQDDNLIMRSVELDCATNVICFDLQSLTVKTISVPRFETQFTAAICRGSVIVGYSFWNGSFYDRNLERMTVSEPFDSIVYSPIIKK